MGIVYNKSGDVIEITVRDMTMRKIEQWKFNLDDIKLGNKIFSMLLNKYGFKPEINPIEQNQQAEEHKKKFLEGKKDWLDIDPNF